MDNPQGPYLADKLDVSVKKGPKNKKVVPWRSPDGTTFPFGKPKGRAKQVKVLVPAWELSDVERGMKKSEYDSMGPYFRDCERRMRHIGKLQRAAIDRVRRTMAAYGLTWKDLEG